MNDPRKAKRLIKKIFKDFMNSPKFKTVHIRLVEIAKKENMETPTKREVMESYLTMRGDFFFRTYVLPALKSHGYEVTGDIGLAQYLKEVK